MTIDDEACYRALAAHDAQFDGLFFVGVTSTGIYCRPICAARTAGRARCRFFSNCALAEREGFRPCLRCRPELAPGHAPVDAACRSAAGGGSSDRSGCLEQRRQPGTIGRRPRTRARQLRRVVQREFGVSPVELAQTQRLLLAKQLLTESDLPIIQVAFASGFESVRRFNALFRSHYGLTPSRMRRASPTSHAGGCIRLTLAYRPPLAWQVLMRFLAGRAMEGVEWVGDQCYSRTVAVGNLQGWLRVAPVAGRDMLSVELATSLMPALPEILARLKNLFDLSARPDVIANHLSADSRLARIVTRCPGLRVPGAFFGFELAIRAILGQRISVRAATTLAGRLADRFGEPTETPVPGLTRLSPTPARLASANEADLTAHWDRRPPRRQHSCHRPGGRRGRDRPGTERRS